MTRARTSIVLDLDGVILQTTKAKAAAMLALFDADAATRRRIEGYIRANGGVRRDHKIVHILRTFLAVSDPLPAVPAYLARYAQALEDGLAAAPLVPGIEDLLAQPDFDFHVSSSAPDGEVEQQLRSRGLLARFDGVFGASVPKTDALARIRATARDGRVVFFGDATTDWEAARSAGVPFVAVVHEGDGFGDAQVEKLRDFTSMDALRHCIAAACA